jgi:hypothetical protein
VVNLEYEVVRPLGFLSGEFTIIKSCCRKVLSVPPALAGGSNDFYECGFWIGL